MPGLTAEAIPETPLWQHMTNVLSRIVAERPAAPLEVLQAVSHHVLTGTAVPPRHTTGVILPTEDRSFVEGQLPPDVLTNTRWAAHFTEALAPPAPLRPLAVAPHPDEEPDDQEEDALDADPLSALRPPRLQEQLEQNAEPAGPLSDVVSEQRLFNALGTGLPPAAAYHVLVGLKQLFKVEPLSSVRFWGKILGRQGDYYIAETTLDPERGAGIADDDPFAAAGDDEEEEEDLPIRYVADVFAQHVLKRHHATAREAAGTGLNALVYYAAPASDPTRWRRLPDVTPEQVCVARQICRGFTGDLEAPVRSHPRFPGLEQHYLRAQIARISCACRIAPRDTFMTYGAVPEPTEDEEGNALPGPEFVPAYAEIPPLIARKAPDEAAGDDEEMDAVRAWAEGFRHGELLQGKHWVHIAPTLLRCGRATAPPAPAASWDDDNPAAVADAIEPAQGDEAGERIRPFLSDLSKDEPLTLPGHSRLQLASWTFVAGYHNESEETHLYLARSLRWPGAVSYARTTDGKPGASYQFLYIGNGLKDLKGADYGPKLPPRRMVEYPEQGLTLQRDCTPQEEQSYAPVRVARDDDDDDDDDNDNDDEEEEDNKDLA